jgi:hypothetical protein
LDICTTMTNFSQMIQNMKSRMNREVHVRFRGKAGVKFPCLTRLQATLKDDTVSMNDRNKHKVTRQVNHQTADPKANASVFLFFPTAHFFKTILASRTNGTFGFARHTSRPFAKPKEPFFANVLT